MSDLNSGIIGGTAQPGYTYTDPDWTQAIHMAISVYQGTGTAASIVLAEAQSYYDALKSHKISPQQMGASDAKASIYPFPNNGRLT